MDCGRGTQHGLLTASFVPSQEQQDLRDLTRLLLSPGARTNSARQSGPQSARRGRTQIVQRAKLCDGLGRHVPSCMHCVPEKATRSAWRS